MKTAILTLAALLMAGAAAAQPTPPPAGNVAHGRQMVMTAGCYECHGTSGEGGSDRTAPRIAPDPLPYPAFVNQLRNPRAQMPVYTHVILSDQDVADIYAYLLQVPHPKPVSQIPLLNH